MNTKVQAYLVAGTFTASQSMMFVLYPLLSERMGLSIAEIVGCFTLGSFLFLWGSPFWARLSDEGWGPSAARAGMIGSAAAIAILLALCFWGQFLPAALCLAVLAASRVLYGLTASAVVPVAQAELGREPEARTRVRSLATLSTVLNAGRLLGPLMILPFAGPWALVLLALPLFINGGLLLSTARAPWPLDFKRMALFKISDAWPDKPEQRLIFMLALLTTCLLGVLQQSLGGYLQERFSLPAAETSALLSKLLLTGAGFMVAAQLILRRVMKHPWQGFMPIAGLLLLVGSLGLSQAQNQVELYAAVILMSLGIAILTPAYISAMSLHGGERQGQSAGNLSTAHTLGYALGGGLSWIGLQWGSGSAFAIASGIAVLLLVLMQPIHRHGRKLMLARI